MGTCVSHSDFPVDDINEKQMGIASDTGTGNLTPGADSCYLK